jgi:enamine deaminase RidA (YjgF/YER057c/UK114 family)
MKKQITNKEVLNEAYDYEKPSGFSRGLRIVNTLYISGTASIDENGKSIHIGDFKKQTERTYYNIKKLLESEGATWKDVVKTTCYLKNMEKNYDEFNKIRLDFFKQEGIDIYPASVGIQATLCRPELLIEMDVIAIIKKTKKSKKLKFTFNEILKLMAEFAIAYHNHNNKDVSNDASEFLDDYLKNKILIKKRS